MELIILNQEHPLLITVLEEKNIVINVNGTVNFNGVNEGFKKKSSIQNVNT